MRKVIGLLIGSVLLGGGVFAQALAGNNPLGFYSGAAIGVAVPPNEFLDPYTPRRGVSGRDFGWDMLVGIRPTRWVGAELQYMDLGYTHLGPAPLVMDQFGRPLGPDRFYGAHGHNYAAAAYAMGYVPLPWGHPRFDVFGKLGVARLWSMYKFAAYYPSIESCSSAQCVPVGNVSSQVDVTETDLAYGGGLQFHVGEFAIRAEYEALDSTLGTPSLFSIGLIWTP